MKPLFSLLLICSLVACGQMQAEGEYIFLEREGAEMPVWIRGKVESDVLLITIHGGPGSAHGHEFFLSGGFQLLEQEVGVVYWDQRASGMAQGSPDPSTFTMENFIADTDAVVKLIRAKFPTADLFLLGHSWGGGLGTAYLADPERAADIAGWIELDGSHNEVMGIQQSRLWAMARAREVIEEGVDADYWAEVLEWYEARPDLQISDYPHWSYLDALGGNIYDIEGPAMQALPMGQIIFQSPFSMGHYENSARSARLDHLIVGLDLTEEMAGITLPTMIAWGRHDGNIPVALAHHAMDSLGTPEADKRLEIFERSAHSPHYEEPEAFAEALSSFLFEVAAERAN